MRCRRGRAVALGANGQVRYPPAMQRTIFADLTFRGQLRPSQAEVVQLVQERLAAEQRKLHIVAPPGSGKTVLGLYLWSQIVRRPAVVLSPNSAIQAQWSQRVSLFAPPGDAAASTPEERLASTAPTAPGLLTSLTYQSIALPAAASADSNLAATSLWVQRLLESGHAESEQAANAWISDLQARSPEYFRERLAACRRQVREQSAAQGRTAEQLHNSSRATMARLADADVGLVILDECHHLMGHWGRAVGTLIEHLGAPVVLGLTATPPGNDGYRRQDVARYHELLGDIDYEVRVPAVVRDGYLAPYQDLAWFVRPTERELQFVAQTDAHFRQLLEDLCQSRADEQARVAALPDWVAETLAERKLPTRTVATWKDYHRLDTAFADAGRAFLHGLPRPLPPGVPPLHTFWHRRRPHQGVAELPLETLTVVLDRYLRHGLRRSLSAADQTLHEQATDRLRLLGIQITETGFQKCASPVSRILGYTHSKVRALIPILECELEQLEEDLRAVVICDFEKSSALAAGVDHVLDEDAGGAVSAFRELIADPLTNTLDPILMTGSTILVDHDLCELFRLAARHWLTQQDYDVELSLQEEDAFFVVTGQGRDWCPRVYIQMITHLFQEGITRCLVGTRGLLAEGWDANRINVLIDLTTVTTSMTVNQLRGRSIRLDPQQPEKLANNWDVICLAPEFAGGLDDYERLCRKHDRIYGITDDGAIEKGVGHVHAALADIHAGDQEHDFQLLNHDMLRRAAQRDVARQLWKIGQHDTGHAVRAVEFRLWQPQFGSHPGSTADASVRTWTAESLSVAFGRVVQNTLHDAGLLEHPATLRHTTRDGGYVSVYLENASAADARVFADSLCELLSPFERPRYLVPLLLQVAVPTRASRWLPQKLGRFLNATETVAVCHYQLPRVLAKSKDVSQLFQSHWNDQISAGTVTYCHQGGGKQLLERVLRERSLPVSPPHVRDCYL